MSCAGHLFQYLYQKGMDTEEKRAQTIEEIISSSPKSDKEHCRATILQSVQTKGEM